MTDTFNQASIVTTAIMIAAILATSCGNNGLSQANAETVLLEDNFNSENGGLGRLNYFGFANWLVSDGTVDLIGNGFFDIYPGNGLYVDLDGSASNAGKLTSKTEFTLSPGTYELKFDVSNTAGQLNTMTIRLGTVYSEEFSLQGPSTPFATITREISVSEPTSGKLSFDHAGGDNHGILLDDVKLSFIGTVDTTPPVITVPDDITREATGPDGAAIEFEVSAQDDVDGIIDDVTCSPESGSIFPIGQTPVQCSATDAAGNTGTGSFTVTVEDTTPPVITVPDDITREATGPDGAAVSFADEVSAEDLVDGSVDVNCDQSSGETFPLGQTTVTCSAEDSRGNSAQESFTITVQDTTAPTVEITGAVDRSGREVADGGTTPIPYIEITFEATDAVGIDNNRGIECSLDEAAFTSCTSPEVYDRLGRGSHEVTVRATDDAANTGEDEFTWTVSNPEPRGGQPSAATTAQGSSLAAEEEQTEEVVAEEEEEEQQPLSDNMEGE